MNYVCYKRNSVNHLAILDIILHITKTVKMKKIIVLITLIVIGLSQYGFSQDTQLLPTYFAVKDALVADNKVIAAAKAGAFAKELASADLKLSQNDRDALVKDATHISESKDIKYQREHFATLSTRLIALAKESKLSAQPIYLMYCPMKKSNWLSSEKSIKNPYYGKSMLTCGSVTQTLD